jgi:uncharacterized membrane protein
MTASKSNRARNARAAAQASAARNAARGGTAVKNGTAARSGADRNEKAGGNGTAVKDRTQARTTQARTTQARAATAAGRGPRIPVVEDDAGQRGPAVWMQITTFVLALAGLGVSVYLTISHFAKVPLACSDTGLVNCTKVTTSPQSIVFGIPVAVLGLAFFVFAVAIMSPWAWQAARREVHLLRIASMVVGIGMVIYLVYAEFIIIGSICLYCTSVHIITFVLFVLTAFGAAVWGTKPGVAWMRGRKADPEAVSA